MEKISNQLIDMADRLNEEVCSLEYSQKLKYLGVKQESLYCYYKGMHNSPQTNGKWIDNITLTYQLKPLCKNQPAWCAFTVKELGDLLPNRINISTPEKGDVSFRLEFYKSVFIDENLLSVLSPLWIGNYVDEYQRGIELIVNKLFPKNICDKKEADCRAQLLIQLIECGFLKI